MIGEVEYTQVGSVWKILGRRKLSFFVPLVLFTLLGIAVALLLPPTYRSEATILIERQLIPADLVATTVRGYVQEQIERIRQRITTHEGLQEIADTHDLFSDADGMDPPEIARALRESIGVDMIDVEARDPDKTGRRTATVAFNVWFENSSPEVAQTVTNELADRFLKEHQLVRTEIARDVAVFLEGEAAVLKEELDTLEVELSKFRQEEFQQLPELMDMNLKLFEKTENDIVRTRARIRELGDRVNEIEGELSLTDPFLEVETESGAKIQSAANRLSSLTAQYIRLTSRYSEKHPDVIKLSREIRILAEQSSSSSRADEVLNQLVVQQESLRQARQSFGNQHPEVVSLEKSVAALQRGLESALVTTNDAGVAPIAPNNPRYVSLRSKLLASQSNIRAEQESLAGYESKLEEYERRLFETPVVDGDLRALNLEYENTRNKYRELRQKLRQAQLAETLEAGGNAERFVLTGAAYLPTLPESPNRIAIIALGILLGGLFGVLLLTVREYLDQKVRGVRSVIDSLGAAPLVVIPNLGSASAVRRAISPPSKASQVVNGTVE